MNSQHPSKIRNISLIASTLTLLILVIDPATAVVLTASGDTTQTETVLWAQSTNPGNLQFEYGTDPSFSNLQGSISGTITNSNLPVKVSVTNLAPKTNYYYRVTDSLGTTNTGRFQTAAPLGDRSGLRFGVSGDWRGELAPYPAISNAPNRNLNFFVELGDTIYADYPSPALPIPQAQSLEDFRQKQAEVYAERHGLNAWQNLRSVTSVLATIDDHEVTNDFQGGAPASSDSRFATNSGLINDTPLYENGLQAFQDFNPLRDEFYGATGDARTDGERKLYRYQTYGSDGAVFLLDARSFRDQGLSPVVNPNDPAQVGAFLSNSFNPSRTLLGQAQLTEMKQDLLEAQKNGILWKFILLPEPIQNLGVVGASDRYEGYAAERSQLLAFIDQNNIENVVFVTADLHGTLVNNLTYQTIPFGPQIPTSAFEIITGSVAFDAPFGPTVIDIALAAGLITPAQKAFYDSLPRAGKDKFVQALVNNQLSLFGYDPLGLDTSKVAATLLQGSYVAAHTYGWTEFEIEKATGQLLVTTYGIDSYTEAQLNANPSAIVGRSPAIVSQFRVTPQTTPEPSAVSALFVLTFLGIIWRTTRQSM